MIYFDQAATSWPKPKRVLDAMTACIADGIGNPSRAGHALSVRAERIVRNARVSLAKLFHVADPDRIIHCFNGTDALNIAIKGVLGEGDHIIVSVLEHNSVNRPLRRLADEGVVTVTTLGIGDDGRVDPQAVRRAITPRTRLIAIIHASNVTGVIQPIDEMGRIAREYDLLFLVDAAQTAGILDVDVARLGIDLLAFSGHKSLLGPTGTGGLYAGPRAKLRPWREGGTGGDSVFPTQPPELPTALEAGTPNTVGLAGLTAALNELDPAAALRHERALIRRLVESLQDHPRIRFVGNADPDARVGVVSFNVTGMTPGDVSAILDESFGIAVRPGLHCAPHAHKALGTFPDGSVRVSVGESNTMEEVEQLIAAVLQIAS